MSAIKSITVYKIDYMQPQFLGENESDKGLLSSQTLYDSNGNVLEETSFFTNGSVEHKSVFKYDDKGKMIEEQLFGEQGEFEEKRAYQYTSEGKIEKELFYYLDDSYDTIIYSYNNQGKLVEKMTVNSDNETEHTETFEFEGELMVRNCVSDSEGNILSEIKNKYDEKQQLVEVIKNDTIEETFSRTEYDYDDAGNRIETRVYNSSDELVSRDIFEINQSGQIVGIVEEDQYSKNTIVLKYNENGNMLEQLETNENGDINHKIEREYDAANNLTRHHAFIDRHGQGINQKITLNYFYEYF